MYMLMNPSGSTTGCEELDLPASILTGITEKNLLKS